MKLSKLCTALLIGTAFTGCAAVVKTPYQAPVVDIPQSFALNAKKSDQIHADVYADRWWTLFNDANLNQLVEQVLASNSDLVVAGINLQQARLQAGLAQDRQGVRVNSSVSTGHNFDLNSGEDSARGVSLSGGVSYEVDLFGRLASQTEAARWELWPPNKIYKPRHKV